MKRPTNEAVPESPRHEVSSEPQSPAMTQYSSLAGLRESLGGEAAKIPPDLYPVSLGPRKRGSGIYDRGARVAAHAVVMRTRSKGSIYRENARSQWAAMTPEQRRAEVARRMRSR